MPKLSLTALGEAMPRKEDRSDINQSCSRRSCQKVIREDRSRRPIEGCHWHRICAIYLQPCPHSNPLSTLTKRLKLFANRKNISFDRLEQNVETGRITQLIDYKSPNTKPYDARKPRRTRSTGNKIVTETRDHSRESSATLTKIVPHSASVKFQRCSCQ